MDNSFPRRNCFELNQPAEIAIRDAMHKVEELGADEKLTDAVIALQKAFDLVADFIDSKTS